MNAGETMTRVYLTLKERIMDGAFLPGERLDPAHLALDLVASPTPVRDALHRLTGERLIVHPHQDGFRVPQIHEAALRDLYEWSHQLSRLLSAAARTNSQPVALPPADESVERARQVFAALAGASPNREHRALAANLNDRMSLVRKAEAHALPDVVAELRFLEEAVRRGAWHEVRILLNRYHQRRVRAVTEIVAWIRPV